MFKSNYIFALILPIIIAASTFAQTESDSLDVMLDAYDTPKSKVDFLNNKSIKHWKTDTSAAFVYLEKAIDIGKKNNLYSGLGDSYRYLGNLYFQQGLGNQVKENYSISYEFYTLSDDSLGLAKITNNLGLYYENWVNDYNKALVYFEKSMRLKKSLKVDNNILASTSFNLGEVHMNLNSYIKSLSYYFEALELLEPLKKYKEIANLNNRIGQVYFKLGEYNLARKYIDIAIVINKKEKDEIQLANDYLLLGSMHTSINQIDSAIVELEKSETIYSNYLNNLGLGRVYTSYIEIYLKDDDIDNVFKYAFPAEEIFLKSGAVYELAVVYNSLGIAYYKVKDMANANKYIEKSLEISSQYNFLEISKRNYLYVAQINYARKDYKKAYNNFYQYSALKDSTFSLKKAQIASEMEDKYAINKKEIELNLLSQEKEKIELERDRNKTLSNYLKLIVILVLVVLSLIFYLYYSNKRLNDRLEDLVDERTIELQESNKLLANSKKNEEDVSRIKSDLLKNISESLRTPIAEIQSLVGILKDENEENFELYEQLELITTSTFRLNAIINSVTELYNIEDKKKVVPRDEFEVNQLIDEIIENHLNQAEARDLRLSMNESSDIIWFNQSRELISNAIDHLMKTIVDYANKGEVDVLTTETLEEKNIILYSSHFNINQKVFNSDLSINNNSLKSSNKQLDRMFISFFVTKKIVEKMNGKIHWEHANEGEGIKFIMAFPSGKVA
ncbi:MAG: tetratricopeptide repeat-containing sensor histidine kinase [Bacteroidota bacterium]